MTRIASDSHKLRLHKVLCPSSPYREDERRRVILATINPEFNEKSRLLGLLATL